jgi:uncharacterized membrane protein YphA (DoxX/SURF4 family)
MATSKTMNIIDWLLRLVVAGILFQTLFFKFTGAEESRYIFSTLLGAHEALGRIGSGVIELITVVLLLMPRAAWFGALLAVGTAAGAILSHLTKLGVEVKGDGGLLFALALTVLVGGALILLLHRDQIPVVGHVFQQRQLSS